MLLIDKFRVWHSKKVNGRLRSLLGKFYWFGVMTRNACRYGDKDMFHFVNIELSRRCNRRCDYCPISEYPDYKAETDLSTEDFAAIIDQLQELDYSGKVCFTGYYEPLMHDDFLEHVRYARSKLKKAKIIVYTNGDLLDELTFQTLQKYSVLLIVSLHNDADGKNYRRIMEITGGNNVIIKKNMERFILSTRGGAVPVRKKEVKTSCILPSVQLTIDSEGNVILCFDDFFSDYTFGNIRDDKLMDIWKSKRFESTRKALRKGRAAEDICKKCF